MTTYDASPLRTPEQQPANIGRVFLVAIGVVILFLAGLIASIALGHPRVWMGLCFGAVLIICTIIYFVVSGRRQRAIQAFMSRNQLKWVDAKVVQEYLPETLNVGRQRKFFDGFGLPIAGRQAFVYDFANKHISAGRYDYVEYEIAAFKTALDAPHIYLRSRQARNQNDGYRRWQRLSLEGDFDAHFTTYVEGKGGAAKIDALEVLTPDILMAIQETVEFYDIEINGPYLALITSEFDCFTPANMDRLLTSLRRLMAKFPAVTVAD